MDAASFKQQFLPCHQKLYRVAYRLMGNTQDAEDMVQEAYLKLWRKRDEMMDIKNVEAYCVTLIKNLCFDAMQGAKFDEDSRPAEELNLSSGNCFTQEIEQKDEVAHLRKLIGQLPLQQKQVVMMRDVNDYSMEEIEKATGLSTVNIRVLLSRARKKIREQFNAIISYESK